ncbi:MULTISPECIES: alpha-ketoacid dehydrogenase subunit beta [unclassified Mycolicibacterium]|uniref:alpha-ketoacid dehydrogenase subunit beta n=1 Tax=unclassified Mycolicibacterium TaxID=2636767 RepID=UPI0012DCB3CB|nr:MULTISPECIES: alpha-ketoacid dehydrogenase subunit beta [unclassified Mycolicibacterium]MUL84754.1 alpha-ketoacid dehydrogenase subunit beta [Mycolicibacterium sp. CBMA 329]MUL88529.1 alpha-ketoacid dehydrogenase subunit beta [Mycolicibacterium sp. CBMA 331]MUM00132.1 alpha-ketoacid dehydrogenase subunit beta [Mycolicibacterium sp. CBMA 334]MUM27797.1 alpha-ketoacid dehydrogenase subunit beta [Mycolicibacterium sp. CBMA 295]MUM40176.1 alpha-ketoacid dehydrogenase subunit beta [Mycolicibacte
MTALTMIESIRQCLREEMIRDDSVLVIGEDVGALGGVFRATDGLLDEFGSDRVVDMPLAEGVIVGSGIGLALSGLRPVIEIQFLGFAHQAFHQIGQQVARLRYRSQGRFAVPVVIRAPFGGGVRTPELHSDAFEAFYTHTPGLKVVAPATASDAKGLLAQAIRDDDPVLFLEPLKGYRLQRDDVADEPFTIPLGKARIAREGDDVTIVAWSAAAGLALRAAEDLASHGIEATVVDLRSLVPLDTDTLIEAVNRTGRVVVVQEAPLTGGFGAEVAATIQAHCFYSLEAPILRIGAPDTPYPLAGIEDMYVPDVARVVRGVHDLMAVTA